jgi:hypothetical protein
MLHHTMREDELVEVSAAGRGIAPTSTEQILEQSKDTAMLMLSLTLGEEPLGVLMGASAHSDLGEKWGAFIRGRPT